MYKSALHSFTTRNSLFYLIISVCLLSQDAFAQRSGYKKVNDLATFKIEFSNKSSKVISIQSPFVQEKVLLALTEKITSTGEFWFKRSNKVRIQYNTPFEYLMVMNGDKILIRDNQKENRVNVNSNKLFQQVNQIMIDCVQGSILDSKDFTTVVYEGIDTYLLEMKPVSKSLQTFFQTIVLIVDKEDYSAYSIEMNEPSGDMTIIRFTDKKINAEVSDAVFAL